MKKILLISLLVIDCVLGAQAENDDVQTCQDNIHKVTSLPYWDQSQTFPCMYAGTFNSSLNDQ